MSAYEKSTAMTRHALNNLFAKILGAADLALHEPCEPLVRAELETIVGLVEEGAALVAESQLPAGER